MLFWRLVWVTRHHLPNKCFIMFLIFVPYLFLNLTLLVKHGTRNIEHNMVLSYWKHCICDIKNSYCRKKINKLVKVIGMFCSSTEFSQALQCHTLRFAFFILYTIPLCDCCTCNPCTAIMWSVVLPIFNISSLAVNALQRNHSTLHRAPHRLDC